MKILLLGATGATGRLILEQLIARGLKPMLVGRNQEKLAALSEKFGGLDVAIADAQQPESLKRVIEAGDLLISTVGPFGQLGKIPLRVAVEQGAHYMDSTGEPEFMSHVYRDYEPKLKNAQMVVMTACGFDYVPGQLAAGKLMQELGDQVSTLNVTYSTADGSLANLTSGTLSSFCSAITEQGTFYSDGQWRQDYLGGQVHEITAGDKKVMGISVPASECYELPRIYPGLKNVNVYLAWFASLAGAMSLFNRLQHQLYKIPGYRSLLSAIGKRIPVPNRTSPSITARDEGNSLIVAEAYNSKGELLGERRIDGHNMYYYTGEIMAWMAAQIQSGQIKEYGVVGPLRAFGLEAFAQAHKEMGFVFQITKLLADRPSMLNNAIFLRNNPIR